MAHSAPGKHYRKGITLLDLFAMFPDDDAAEAWFIACRWPDGVRCPKCDSANVARKKHPTMPLHCGDCRKFFSVKTGSVMESSKVGCLGYRHLRLHHRDQGHVLHEVAP